MQEKTDAVVAVIDAVYVEGRAPHYHEYQVQQLAMEWPTLAAAIGDLLEEHHYPVPSAFRRAKRVLKVIE